MISLKIIRDLHYLMKILNKLADLCQQQPNYIDAMVEILQHCIKPFLLDKSTDAEIYSSALVAFYADFGMQTKNFDSNQKYRWIYFRLFTSSTDKTSSEGVTRNFVQIGSTIEQIADCR